jgi:hypothetical protein
MVLTALKDITRFISFNCACLSYGLSVPGFRQTNSLRKRGRWNYLRPAPPARHALRQAMNSFDMTAALYSQTWNTRIVPKAFNLLVKRH